MDMLTFTIDTDSKVPIYQQLYTYIKTEIQLGRLKYNSKLPSKRKLAAYLNVSLNTVQGAYDQLMEEGYIVSVEKKGFYVSRLDNVIKINVRESEAAKPEVKASRPCIKYDFSYHGVDTQTFPFAIWRRLARDVYNEYDTELLHMGDPQGLYSLREVISLYLFQSRGVVCSPEQIILSSGTEFLFQILFQLFDKDSVYGIENPGYERLSQLFSSNRASFRAVNIDEGGMIPGEIVKSSADILCVTPAHQFPSGEIMPINRRLQILNWANEVEGRYIIEDDYDSEFKYSGKPIPALQGLDTNQKVIYMGTFSKSLSPAFRVSYMVLPPHLLKGYKESLSYSNCPVPVPDQKILCRFIQDGYFERHLNKMRNVYKRKRELLVSSIEKHNCPMEIRGAEAGLHLLLKVDNGMTEEQLVNSALEHGIKVYGISRYYTDKRSVAANPFLLIGFAAMSEDDLVKAVDILHRAWFL